METTPVSESAECLADVESRPVVRVAGSDLGGHLLLALAAGLLADYLFRDRTAGISVPIFFAFLYGAAHWSLRSRPFPSAGFELFLPIATFLLAISYAVFTNPVFSAINALLLPLLFALQVILWARFARHTWDDVAIARDFAEVGLRLPVNSVAPAVIALRDAPMRPELKAALVKIVVGLLISLPLVGLILILLNSADQMFASYLKKLADAISTLRLDTLFSHAFWIGVVAFVLSGFLWTMRTTPPREARQRELRDHASWDALIVSTVLVMINLIYCIFCWIQFSYLFAGAQGQLPAGFSYAEYARRGFAELSMVTLLNVSIVLCGVYCVRFSQGTVAKVTRILLTLLGVQSLIILASTFTRLSLYEAAYGYTYMRLFARTMILFMGVVLVLSLVRTWLERYPFWKSLLLSALVMYAGLNYMNVDGFIARKNIERYRNSKELDLHYLLRLSDEAVPSLTTLLDDPNEVVRQKVGEELMHRRMALESKKGWPSFNVSRRKALAAIDLHV